MTTASRHDSTRELTWRLDGLRATAVFLDGSSDHAPTIRLDAAELGVTIDPAASSPDAVHLLGLELAPLPDRAGARDEAPTDAWVRGADVVAVYEPSDPRFLRTTAMWRHWPVERPTHQPRCEELRAWELIVSCQTSLFESDATVAVLARLPARAGAMAAVAAEGAHGFSTRWHGLDVLQPPPSSSALLVRLGTASSVLVAVHPHDARRITIRKPAVGKEACLEIECWLFPSVVEKGVLLRGRTLAAIGPSDGDVDWATRLLDAFAASPPVLTT